MSNASCHFVAPLLRGAICRSATNSTLRLWSQRDQFHLTSQPPHMQVAELDGGSQVFQAQRAARAG